MLARMYSGSPWGLLFLLIVVLMLALAIVFPEARF
jgi:F0F1-type ATP synthase assembly protein I